MSGSFDAYPSGYPIPLSPSKVDKEKVEARKQTAIRRYSESWNIRSWINVNQQVNISIEEWLGYDDFQDKFGLDQVVLDAIHYEMENIRVESSQRTRSQREGMSQQSQPLSLPKNLLSK